MFRNIGHSITTTHLPPNALSTSKITLKKAIKKLVLGLIMIFIVPVIPSLLLNLIISKSDFYNGTSFIQYALNYTMIVSLISVVIGLVFLFQAIKYFLQYKADLD